MTVEMTVKAKETREKPYHGSSKCRVEVVVVVAVVVVGFICNRWGVEALDCGGGSVLIFVRSASGSTPGRELSETEE